ncbi:hypothetical protein BV25DRAFT_1912459 [Artomyces pyxidatus]|uniref:Uncharacterized protein n=1 Tax=Artomyces pyxidatus TaxID=48021 RepID=A0ACB8TFD5_9AGAM|nr:hypothetical protein BV25DRAFT_1912459 [Artomyces pyxidatus]
MPPKRNAPDAKTGSEGKRTRTSLATITGNKGTERNDDSTKESLQARKELHEDTVDTTPPSAVDKSRQAAPIAAPNTQAAQNPESVNNTNKNEDLTDSANPAVASAEKGAQADADSPQDRSASSNGTADATDASSVAKPSEGSDGTTPPGASAETSMSPSLQEIAGEVRARAPLYGWNDKLIAILPDILSRSDAANSTYVPTNVPDNLMWRNKHMSVPGQAAPVTIQIIGTLRYLWFFDGNGAPQKRVAIRVVPFQDEALSAMTSILRKYTEPPTAVESTVLQDIHSSAFSTTRERGKTGTVGVPYPNVFDGRKTFSFNKSEMPRLGAEFLRVGDTVIQEVAVGKFHASSNYKEQPSLKNVWRISFDLRGIILLSSGGDEGASGGGGEGESTGAGGGGETTGAGGAGETTGPGAGNENADSTSTSSLVDAAASSHDASNA